MSRFEKDDTPTSPKHYKIFKGYHITKSEDIESLDVIRVSLTEEEYLGYLKGNILKYMIRHKNKNGNEDLKKSHTYMKFLNDVQDSKI